MSLFLAVDCLSETVLSCLSDRLTTASIVNCVTRMTGIKFHFVEQQCIRFLYVEKKLCRNLRFGGDREITKAFALSLISNDHNYKYRALFPIDS